MEENIQAPEKEIIYTFEACHPEQRDTKTAFVKPARLPLLLGKFLIPVVMAEMLVLSVLDQKDAGTWSVLLICIAFLYVFVLVILPQKAKKRYLKIHAAGEDRIAYTFYADSVRLKSPTAEALLEYSKAEYYMENDRFLMICFTLGRRVTIDKQNCDAEQLAFFKAIVPLERQRKKEKTAAISGWLSFTAVILYIFLLACEIKLSANPRTNSGASQYPSSTYESFVGCLKDGHVKDVVVKEHYLEYTFTGHSEDERFSAYYNGDLSELKGLIENAYGSPYPKTTYSSFLLCLMSGSVTDIEIINHRFVEYTFTGNGRDERLYTIVEEEDLSSLTETLNGLGADWKYREAD